MTKELKNAERLPEIYYCRHMEMGLCGYQDETILIETDDLKKLIPSMPGKPVYVQHQDVDIANLQEKADGYVTDCFYNEVDGWLWAKFIVVSDAGHEAVAKGWSVSNAYIPTEWGAGGSFHNVDYNRKVVNAEFTHLAIVPNPRYEGAQIFTPEEFKAYQLLKKNDLKELQNSKENKGAKPMIKFFKNERKEVSSIDEDTVIELQNGKEITLKEMINAVKKNEDEEAEAAAKKEKVNMDDEVDVGGEKMPVGELVNKYNAMMKKNAEDCAAKEKANAEEEAEKKKKDDEEKVKAEEKANAKHFDEIRNAATAGDVAPTAVVETMSDRLARGKANY